MADSEYHKMVQERTEAEWDELKIDRMLMTLLLLDLINSSQYWALYRKLDSYWSERRRQRKQILRNLNEL